MRLLQIFRKTTFLISLEKYLAIIWIDGYDAISWSYRVCKCKKASEKKAIDAFQVSWINGARVSWSWVTESIHYYICMFDVYETATAMIILFLCICNAENLSTYWPLNI